jgi:hypothetical protein
MLTISDDVLLQADQRARRQPVPAGAPPALQAAAIAWPAAPARRQHLARAGDPDAQQPPPGGGGCAGQARATRPRPPAAAAGQPDEQHARAHRQHVAVGRLTSRLRHLRQGWTRTWFVDAFHYVDLHFHCSLSCCITLDS